MQLMIFYTNAWELIHGERDGAGAAAYWCIASTGYFVVQFVVGRWTIRGGSDLLQYLLKLCKLPLHANQFLQSSANHRLPSGNNPICVSSLSSFAAHVSRAPIVVSTSLEFRLYRRVKVFDDILQIVLHVVVALHLRLVTLSDDRTFESNFRIFGVPRRFETRPDENFPQHCSP